MIESILVTRQPATQTQTLIFLNIHVSLAPLSLSLSHFSVGTLTSSQKCVQTMTTTNTNEIVRAIRSHL